MGKIKGWFNDAVAGSLIAFEALLFARYIVSAFGFVILGWSDLVEL